MSSSQLQLVMAAAKGEDEQQSVMAATVEGDGQQPATISDGTRATVQGDE